MQFSLICVLMSCLVGFALSDPAGSYCGTYLDSVSVKATVITLEEASVTGSVFGSAVSCPSEAAVYDKSSGKITLTDITAPADCVGKLLTSYGIDPSSLSLQYVSTTNVINVAVTGITLTLSHCPFPLSTPKGSYCGAYSGAVIEATVLTLSSVKLNATIDGYAIGCNSEATKFDESSGVITFPDINQPTDCLGSALQSLGISASGLSVVYNAVADTIHVSDGAVSVVLSHCPSLQKVLRKN
eukprot:TRINITY_DN66_c0_g1_i1.p1 TRINITY_DN66_c0_g1~~TRINITY_DN66_c0_g1_i1.p1  ORF type:complete len:242 (+),score=51.95 TRINITY_DN66_c0_g1_i1:83-808(+)